MKLMPLRYLDLRRKKTLDHYYGVNERWWDLSGHDEDDWRHDRENLDGKNLDSRTARAQLGDGLICATIAKILDGGHARWFHTTERECDHAEEHPHPDEPRKFLVSQNGVIVVVHPSAPIAALVTAFRPDVVAPEDASYLSAARAYVKRCAVRRTQRRTLYK